MPESDASNSLEPSHSVFLLADDGTVGQYSREPSLRTNLEVFISSETSLTTLGKEGIESEMLFNAMVRLLSSVLCPLCLLGT